MMLMIMRNLIMLKVMIKKIRIIMRILMTIVMC